jgi:hypothetical protein
MESLTDLFGFKDPSVRLGELKESQTIREAIVAVPYITTTNGSCGDVAGQEATSEQKQFFTIPRERIEAALNVGTAKGDAESSAGDSIRNLIQNVREYVLPPDFDFLSDLKKSPLVMYFFEFEYEFDKDDLSYIWQNLAPRDYKKMEQKLQTASHTLANNELLQPEDILENKNLRWMVFKVKQRGMSKYENKIYRQVGTKGADSSTSGYQIEYNWPYDYLSFVEMVNVDVEVLMNNEVEIVNTSTEIAKTTIPATVSADRITSAAEDMIVDTALSTIDLPGDMT